MSNSSIDSNSRGSLTAVSSTDGVTIVDVYADPDTHRLLTQTASNLSGEGAPATIPSYLGQMYVDTEGPDIYTAVGIASPADWVLTYETP